MINCFVDTGTSCPLTYFLKINTMYEFKMKKVANIRTKHCAILNLSRHGLVHGGIHFYTSFTEVNIDNPMIRYSLPDYYASRVATTLDSWHFSFAL